MFELAGAPVVVGGFCDVILTGVGIFDAHDGSVVSPGQFYLLFFENSEASICGGL
jgi:hypothetical protein